MKGKVCRGNYYNFLKGFEICPHRDNCDIYDPEAYIDACIDTEGVYDPEAKRKRIVYFRYIKDFRKCKPVKI